MTTGAAVFDRSGATSRIEHVGKDALDLLHRLSTNDMLSLKVRDARGTVLTSDRGRVLGVVNVVRVEEHRLLLLNAAPDPKAVIDWIDRFTFDEDAKLRDITVDTAQIAVAGPKAGEVIRVLTGIEVPSDRCVVTDIAGVHATVIGTDALGTQCYEWVVPVLARDDVVAAATEAGAVLASADVWQAVRIEHGVPAWGNELSEDVNPLEAGLRELVSFTKGCYVGQEVVARLDTYDKVQRRLVGLTAASALVKGDELSAEGRVAGKVTSAAYSPRLRESIGLGYVRRDIPDGTSLRTAHGPVKVVSPPFVRRH